MHFLQFGFFRLFEILLLKGKINCCNKTPVYTRRTDFPSQPISTHAHISPARHVIDAHHNRSSFPLRTHHTTHRHWRHGAVHRPLWLSVRRIQRLECLPAYLRANCGQTHRVDVGWQSRDNPPVGWAMTLSYLWMRMAELRTALFHTHTLCHTYWMGYTRARAFMYVLCACVLYVYGTWSWCTALGTRTAAADSGIRIHK